ncbi:MAG: hypothetical protein C00003105_02084 [ANME-2 cluster archaeon HR1]|nr:MAG: hypothetical protein C00003105_02084 [ANME-2 cluster archaeon HR1]
MQQFIYDPVFITNVKMIINTANIVLLLLLLAIYIRSYFKIKSKFTLGLMIFAFLLLMQEVTLRPCMSSAMCEHRIYVIGPFDMVPDIIGFFALLVLMYLSSE